MGHKSYVNPTLDDDDVGNGHRPVRRKGSDMPEDQMNERSPLTGHHDRKKDRPLPWAKDPTFRRALMAVVMGMTVLLLVFGVIQSHDDKSLTTTPPEQLDVMDGIPDAKEDGTAERGGALPLIGTPFLPADVDPALSLTQLLALWKLPEDAVTLMTYREWVELHEYLTAAAARFEAVHGSVLENAHPSDRLDQSNLPINNAATNLALFHRILGEIRVKLDDMQAHVATNEASGAHAATDSALSVLDSAVPLAQTPMSAIPMTSTTAVPPTTTIATPQPTTSAPTTTTSASITTTSATITTTSAPIATTPPATPTTSISPATRAPITLPMAPSSEPAPTDAPPAAVLGYQKGLSLWLQADQGVEFAGPCPPDSSQCYVKQWKNSAGAASFYPANLANPTTFPVWLPRIRNGLPTLHLTCPMVYSNGVLLRDGMTLFFVLSPAHLTDDPNDAKLQKFFGHAPYGQLRFQARKAAYFGPSAVVAEDNDGIAQGEFAVVAYRLDKGVSIQVNGQGFRAESPVQAGGAKTGLPISATEATTLGNVKSLCDANAFHGRVAEVLVFDTVLPNDALEAVHSYLHQKWAIPRGVPRVAPPDQGMHTMSDDPVSPVSVDESHPDTPKEESTPQDESSSLPPPARKSGGGRESFNRDDVFKWQPSSDADPAQVALWKEAVAEKIRSVERFQFGGKILHDFIDSLKTELNDLRDNMFG
ncbi:hypothetical protein H310_14211 [Aphanomyces invadans]|uniref:LamG-like jellyroll fold domain-containing protein n=1 Tax=Aphanomyces invadans TaxID=157072 RepID=A0A024TAD6_9STRA|nr:hypothetical protein H310_14211 [Aphanomyces invadans]ETV91115.1 hypothetical protein H310_14211 [Aphanomyces invadans]|eukprot:XP_008880242.1 hypothetical protein H310_14211 [Aphanomyces invadans]